MLRLTSFSKRRVQCCG